MAYLLPVLGGLTREEMERDVLPPLMEGDRVDERLLKRMISESSLCFGCCFCVCAPMGDCV